MTTQLSARSRSVENALLAFGINAPVKQFPTGTRSALEAAQSIGCELEQIVKSLVFLRAPAETVVLVLVSGRNVANIEALRVMLGGDVRLASATEVRRLTGFVVGGVPPIGHPSSFLTIMDEDLLKHPTVWAAAGTPNAVFEIAPRSLCEITAATVGNVGIAAPTS